MGDINHNILINNNSIPIYDHIQSNNNNKDEKDLSNSMDLRELINIGQNNKTGTEQDTHEPHQTMILSLIMKYYWLHLIK